MKKLINRVLGVVVAAALLMGSVMPTVAVMAAGDHSKDTKIETDATCKYTITLTKPAGEDITVDASATYGAYQIFTGKVPENPKDVDNSNYDASKGGYQNPGDKNATLPITDIKWGNAFGTVNTDLWGQNIVKFVIALAKSKENGYGYAFSKFGGFEDFVNGNYLSDDYTDGTGLMITGETNANINKVKFDKLAVAVAKVIAAHDGREWLQAFSDILGGYTKDDAESYVTQYYASGTWDGDKCTISVPAGYYMIIDRTTIGTNATDEAYSARMLFVANNVTQTLKEDVPTLKKQIDRGTEGYKSTEVAGVGDTINFRLTGTLPNNYANYLGGYQYIFTDTLSNGLTLDNVNNDTNEVTVTVTAKGLFKWNSTEREWEWTDEELEIPADYTRYADVPEENVHHLNESGDDSTTFTYNYKAVKDTRENKFTVTFPCLREIRLKDSDDNYYCLGYYSEEGKSSEIYVDYSATINENALVSPANSPDENGNENAAMLTYSNDPQAYDNIDNTTEHKTTVYTFGLDIIKVNAAEFLQKDGYTAGNEETVGLEGARFVLLRRDGTSSADYKWYIAKFNEKGSSTEETLPKSFQNNGYNTILKWEEISVGAGKNDFDKTWIFDDDGNIKETYSSYKGSLGTSLVDGYYNITTLEKGILNVSGLDAGVIYTMVETQAPGAPGEYARIEPFTITLTPYKDDDSGEYNGLLTEATSDKNVAPNESFSLSNYVEITDPVDGTENNNNGSAGMFVANFEYENLPSTGGIGIYPFYIIGGIVVAGSIILFALSRRKKTA